MGQKCPIFNILYKIYKIILKILNPILRAKKEP